MYNLILSAGNTRFAKSGDAERFNNGRVAATNAAAAALLLGEEHVHGGKNCTQRDFRLHRNGSLVISCSATDYRISISFDVWIPLFP